MRTALPAAVMALLAVSLAAPATTVELLGARPDPRQVSAGRAVAAGAGGQGQANACFRCHGFSGGGDAAAAVPAIGGQSAEYLQDQLRHFAEGTRPNAIMAPIAAALSEDARRDVALYYAAQPVPSPGLRPDADAALLQWGGILAATGSAETGVQACQNCHGPAGLGMPPLYPRLAGQPATYLAAQLQAWRSGERPGVPPHHTMATIARRLSDHDIRAVALYFAAVRTEAAPLLTGVLP